MARKLIDLTTTKAFGNPVQMDTEHLFLFLFRSASFGSSTSIRSINAEKELKMRQKTAHIGLKASLASQGKRLSFTSPPSASSTFA
jgi:hypothetical protein